MANSDLREWLGFGPADLPSMLALACCAGMFFVVDHLILDLILAGTAVFLAVLASLIGIKTDPTLSSFTNWTKKITYPLFVVGVLAYIAVDLTFLNHRHELRSAQPDSSPKAKQLPPFVLPKPRPSGPDKPPPVGTPKAKTADPPKR